MPLNSGVGIGGRLTNNLRRYPDDTTLLAESEEDLMKLCSITNQLVEHLPSGSLGFKHLNKHSNKTVDKEWLAWQAITS